MTEVQEAYRRVSDGLDTAVRAVPPKKRGAQSACKRWKAGEVVAHAVAATGASSPVPRSEISSPLALSEAASKSQVGGGSRFIACIWGFSSTANTTSASGGPDVQPDAVTDFFNQVRVGRDFVTVFSPPF